MGPHPASPSHLLLLLLLPLCALAQFPLPKSVATAGAGADVSVSKPFSIDLSRAAQPGSAARSILDEMVRTVAPAFEYASGAQPVRAGAAPLGGAAVVVPPGASTKLEPLQTDESYKISVRVAGGAATATISANTVYGAFRGMQTLALMGMAGLKEVDVEDEPRFKWRGFMVDTGRAFMSPAVLMSVIRTAAWARMNVMHWHVTDAQSVPLESAIAPLLSKGAFSPDKVYTLDATARLKAFARRHGITIVTEFDLPGHSWAFGVGYPASLPAGFSQDAYCDWKDCEARGVNCRVGLSPASDTAYWLIDALLKERAASEPFLHMGADEVEAGCWWHDDPILAMKGDKTMIDGPLWDFLQKYRALATSNGIRDTIVWDDVFQVYPMQDASQKVLPTDWIVQVWGGNGKSENAKPLVFDALDRGHRVISSPANKWYLGGNNPDWNRYWSEDPACKDATTCLTDPAKLSRLLGGEGCLWETAEHDLWWGLFWNSFLIGERLWSPQSTIDQANAKQSVMATEMTVSPALPRISVQYPEYQSWVPWTLAAYNVVGSVWTPIAGSLGDIFGVKWITLVSLCIYLVGQIGCALSRNIFVLIAFRAVQGVGMGIFVLCFTAIKKTFPTRWVPLALGVVSGMFSVGTSFGFVGGAGFIKLLEHTRWEYVFLFYVPFLLIVIVAFYFTMPDVKRDPTRKVDFVGAALLGVGVTALLIGLTLSDTRGWRDGAVLGLVVGGAVVMAAFLAAEFFIKHMARKNERIGL
eukprot:m51a1_g478 putative glycosyl hydrolase family 20 protein (754) ;mRNA; f:201788-205619